MIKTIVKKVLWGVVSPALLEVSTHNIAKEMQYRALTSSTDFVLENMKGIDYVNTNFQLLKLAVKCITINGLFLEFGVFNGTSINFLSKIVPTRGGGGGKYLYGFDSFEGLPEHWRTGFSDGKFKLKRLPKVRRNVELIKGWFNDTLPDFLKKHNEPISFLHIDCDLYSSTRTVFEYCKDRIVSGTVIVFDDYFNYPGWENGEHKAFMEFIDATGLHYKYIGYNCHHTQLAVVIE